MDDRRRLIFAIALMVAVVVLPSIMFPTPDQPPAPVVDSTLVQQPATPSPFDSSAFETAPTPVVRDTVLAETPTQGPTPSRERTVTVASDLFEYQFSSRGARFVGATLLDYRALQPGAEGPANILPDDSDFLAMALVFGRDTLPISEWHFEPSADRVVITDSPTQLSWVARRGTATVRLTYMFQPDEYLFRVQGQLEGLPSDNPLMVISIGPGLHSVEVDSTEDFRAFGVVTKADNTQNLKFSSLDPGEFEELVGPFEWMAVKSKYFIGAILAIEDGQTRFGGGLAKGLEKAGRQTTKVDVSASLAVPGGAFSYSVYVGPQENRRLSAIGHDLEDANPYGWILRPIIRPFSLIIVRVLVWGHENLDVAYGWILVFFGVAIRLLMWPLNQKAMKSQMAVQEIQPEIEEIKKKYKDDQQKLGQEQWKLYKERGISPLGGCLPMLLPMPILFAFFFVFLNTIELRGVPWLWLPDLSRPDPLYIIPILMGGSMFLVTKLGQRGIPPNPQAKVMLYAMPIVFTVMFFNFSSGLNLYYTSQQVASLPQQWFISKQRAAARAAKK